MQLSVDGEEDWGGLFTGAALKHLEERLLPPFIARQRWFGGKSRHILSTALLDWGAFDGGKSALVLLAISYADAETETYLVPLGMSFGAASTELQKTFPDSVISPLSSPRDTGVLRDGLFSDRALTALLALIADGGTVPMNRGSARGLPSSILDSLRGHSERLAARRSAAEQSNSSIFFGDTLIMKLFRKQQPGINPDTEIGRYLTEHTGFLNIAPFGGSIEYVVDDAVAPAAYTFAMLQGLVANEGDGWQWTLHELDRYYESTVGALYPAIGLPSRESRPLSEILPDKARRSISAYLDAAATLGRRTGELHVALGRPTPDQDFSPESFTAADARQLREKLSSNATHAFDALQESLGALTEESAQLAAQVLSRRNALLEQLHDVTAKEIGGLRIRVHGDYHLGQVLRTGSNFVILDFEGEPSRPLADRRSKQSPLKDVAGMLRSFSYAAFDSLTRFVSRRPREAERATLWAHWWERAVGWEFLNAYRRAVGPSPILPSESSEFQSLLDAFILDKAFYELLYELNNRPAWVRIPLHGILSLTPEG